MRRLSLLLASLALVAPLSAEDATMRDKKSGLVVEMPDQWNRDAAREKGSVRFAAIYDILKTRYVLFSVETGPSRDYEEAQWLAGEKAGAEKFLKSIDTAWKTEPVMVGGVRGVRYTIGGKATGEKEFDLRIRGCGFVKDLFFFRILEHSYNKAHEEAGDALQAMWDGVKFEEANPFASEEEEEGCGEEEAPAGGGAEESAPKGEPAVVEDKAGNFKVTAPPGWTLDRPPADDDGTGLRVLINRTLDNGSVVASMEIFRFRWQDSEVFTTMEPADFLIKKVAEDNKFFETFYDEGSAKLIRPEIDVRTRLGGADKSCAYEMRALRLSEEKEIEDAKKLINRGDTSVKVPEFLPRVVRGRIAMISPYIYIARTEFARSLSDNEELLAQYNQILDSWEFESTEGRPPPLLAGAGGQLGPLGNTVADPANKEERKKSKVHEYRKGTKVEAALKIDYVLPPGFQEVDVVQDEAAGGAVGGEDVPLQVVAQNDNNGWVWIKVIAKSQKSLAPQTKFEDKNTTFDSWIGTFSSLARGTGKLPKKPEKITIGNLRGDGCELEGKINNFRASELNMVTFEKGWWIKIEMKTRGGGRTDFEDEIKTFLKRFKATKK